MDEGSVGTRASRGMPPAACGDSARLPRDIGPSNPGVEVLLMLGRDGRSKPGSSFRGELAPEGTREEIVGRTGGSRGSSSRMLPKRLSLIEEARDRVLVLVRVRGLRPFTGEAVLDRDMAVVDLENVSVGRTSCELENRKHTLASPSSTAPRPPDIDRSRSTLPPGSS